MVPSYRWSERVRRPLQKISSIQYPRKEDPRSSRSELATGAVPLGLSGSDPRRRYGVYPERKELLRPCRSTPERRNRYRYKGSGREERTTRPPRKLLPSEADKNLTQKIKVAGETLDIKLLDHLIITEKEYLSFADEGIL